LSEWAAGFLGYLYFRGECDRLDRRIRKVEEKLDNYIRKRASGTATITGDGSTTEFQVEVQHNLPSDKIAVSVSTTRPTTATPSYIFAYVDDKDNDGFRETIVITVRFDTAPADGEEIEIYWRAEVVEV